MVNNKEYKDYLKFKGWDSLFHTIIFKVNNMKIYLRNKLKEKSSRDRFWIGLSNEVDER